jgi:catechol 2,3-dioxygenase-like lactoylglutathione lyase family enzyme
MKRSWSLAVALVAGAAVTSVQAQQRPAITGIAFARMYASNVPASDAFYKMLGFPQEPARGELQRFDVSASQWLEVEPLPTPAPAARLAAVGFTTRDAAGLEKYLRAKGVEVIEPLKQGEFTVLDPEGNHIVFVQSGSHAMLAPRTADVGVVTSRRIIHAGFAVKSADAENHFYREILGFHEYWHGGMKEDRTDWVSLQVPDGSDWIEYMLNGKTSADSTENLRQLGVMDHFSLGVAHMQDAVDELARNGCASTPQAANCAKTQMGRDGKVQLNVFDPDMTRVEYMEFKPSGPICCSEIKGKQPTEVEDK